MFLNDSRWANFSQVCFSLFVHVAFAACFCICLCCDYLSFFNFFFISSFLWTMKLYLWCTVSLKNHGMQILGGTENTIERYQQKTGTVKNWRHLFKIERGKESVAGQQTFKAVKCVSNISSVAGQSVRFLSDLKLLHIWCFIQRQSSVSHARYFNTRGSKFRDWGISVQP